MAKKTNWDLLSGHNAPESGAKRDVYNSQQLERGKIADKQSPVSRLVFAVIVSVLISVAIYFAYAGVSFGYTKYSPGSPPVFRFAGDDYSEPKLHYNPSSKYGYIGSSGDGSLGYSVNREIYQLDEYGNEVKGTRIPYESEDDLKKIKVPDWYKASKANFKVYVKGEGKEQYALFKAAYKHWQDMQTDFDLHWKRFDWKQILCAFAAGLCIYLLMYEIMMRNLKAQNMLSETSDINQYANDQHIMLPEEVMRRFDWFPDLGAHSDISVSSMISHVALDNKGLKSVKVSKRADKDIVGEDGEMEYLKGEVLYDDDGNIIYEEKPMIDTDFMHKLFSASGIEEKDKVSRKFYDISKVPYNIGNKDIDKLKDYDYVSDLINKNWTIPWYEVRRPAGAYLVDTRPVNTLVIAITRAGDTTAVECIQCEVLRFAVC